MTGKHIDYYFTPISPWTYLGHERLEAMARKYGATIAYKPVDFGRIFAASGGLPLANRPPQRQAYRLVELARWPKLLGLPLNLHPKYFPAPADLAAKLILAAVARNTSPGKLASALMRAVWAEERNIADRETLEAIAGECDLAGDGLLATAETPEMAARYGALTQEAIDRQVFGAPTYIYREEPFWGQDRLDFLERALSA